MVKVLLIFSVLLCLGCNSETENSILTTEEIPEFVAGTEGTVFTVAFTSKEVVKGEIGEVAKQEYNIYLPPSYYHNDKKYPVIYYLHGFGEYNYAATNENLLMDSLILTEGAEEFIIVEPTAGNILGGSFYTNSVATGNWENYIVEELVTHIDQNYRTVDSREGRGIAGFSMGGTGAINLGFKHSNKFNAIYAFSAGILKDGDLDKVIDSWGSNSSYFNSYGAAISPNIEKGYPYAEIPNKTYDDEIENQRVIDNWYSLFGNHSKKLDTYLENGPEISGVKISATRDDSYRWISEGTEDLHNIMNVKEIPHEYEMETTGGHYLPENFTVTKMIPFFSKHL